MLKMRKKIPFTPQLTKFDCGTACLSMVMSYYGSKHPLEEINERIGLSRNGLSVKDIVEVAKEYHFNSKVFQLEKIEYLRGLNNYPLIALTQDYHFIVISKFKKNYYQISDPNTGEKKVNAEELEPLLSNAFILIEPSDSLKINKRQKNNFSIIFELFSSYSLLALAILFALISQALTLIIPQITQFILDEVITQQRIDLLLKVVLVSILVITLYGVMIYLRAFFISRIAVSLSVTLNEKLLAKLFRLPLSYFELRSSGDIATRMGTANSIAEPISQIASTLIIDVLSIFVIGFAMFSKSFTLSLVAISFAVLQSILTAWGIRKMQSLYSKEFSANEKTRSYLYEMLTNMYIVKSTGLESNVLDNWRALFSKEIKISKKKKDFTNLIESMMGVLRLSPSIVLLLVGSIAVIQSQLTIGGLIAFSTLISLFLMPFNSIIGSIQSFNQIRASVDRVREILYAKVNKKDSSDKQKIQSIDSIRLEDVNFSYSKNSGNILKNINLSINKGERVALVGKSGGGKTTLVKLLLGLYEEKYSGRIFINDIPLEKIDETSFRKKVGVVYQDSFFFDDSFRKNVDFTNEYSLQEVAEVCNTACIKEEIENMPLKYNTIIGELGKNISGGQKQRLAIARSLMRNPSLLILDEATHQIDAITEKKINQNLKSKAITQIIISHRLQNIVDSDKIIVIDNSQIKGIGSHQELLMENDLYKELWENQVY